MKILALAGATALALVTSPAFADASLFAGVVGDLVGTVVVPLAWTIGGVAVFAVGNGLWGAINRGLDLFEKKTGIEVDAQHRAALHSALDTGLHLALQRGAPVVEDAVAAWVRTSVPGAVTHFGLDNDMLGALVDAKMGKATAAAIAAPLALPGAILSGLAGAGAAVESPAMDHAAGGNGGN